MRSQVVVGLALGWVLGAAATAGAQVIPDGTLGTENSQVNGTRIEGGAIRDTNLFHSFQEFNIGNGQRIDFANPAGVTDIFSRVTGGNPSKIFGTLGVDGAANLTLLNPNGILFGPNAQLDIRGSFTTTTADSVAFSGGYEFSATNPTAPPLLHIGVPLGLQRGTNPTGGAIVNEATLEMQLGEEIILSAEEVRHKGKLIAPGGRVAVLGDRVAVEEDAVVDVSNPDGDGGTALIGGAWQGEGSLPTARRTFVGKDAKLMANGGAVGSGGEVVVWADEMAAFYGEIEARGGAVAGDGGRVEVSGREFLDFRGTVETLAVNGAAGSLLIDPTIIEIVDSGSTPTPTTDLTTVLNASEPNVHGDRTFLDVSVIENNTNITLRASQDIVFNAQVFANSIPLIFSAEAGNDITLNDSFEITPSGSSINLKAGNNITLNNGRVSTIGGNIEIEAVNGSINTNGYEINTGTSISGNDDSGHIRLEANGNISTGRVDTSAGGDAGNIDLISYNGSINTTNGVVNSGGSGSGGDILFRASQNITTNEISTLNIDTDAGSITLVSENGNVDTTAGRLSTGFFSNQNHTGNGNTIQLTAANEIEIGDVVSGSEAGSSGEVIITSQNSSIDTSQGNIITSSLSGTSNSVTLQAEQDITLGGVIDASANGQGSDIAITSNSGSITGQDIVINSGNIGIRAYDELVNGRGVNPDLIPGSDNLTTIGGDIKLQAGENINLNEVAVIASGNSPVGSTIGAGGKIDFLASETGSINLDTAYVRSISSQGAGEDLTFSAGSLTLKNRSSVGVRATETAQSGNIHVIAPEFVQLSNLSGIEAQNRSNQVSGNVTIHPTQRLTLTGGSVLSASTVSTSPDGRGGVLEVTAELVEVIGSDPDGLAPSTLTSYSSREDSATAGDAGDVRIRAERVELRDGGSIFASSLGVGAGGNIDVEADSIVIEGTTNSQFLSSGIAADAYGDGRSGNVSIKTKSLTVADGGVISTSTFGPQAGGDISIQADEMRVQGMSANNQVRSGIYAQSFDAGDGGNVALNINNLQLDDRAKITVSSDPAAPDSQFLVQKSNDWIDALRNVEDSEIPADFAVGTGSTAGGDAGNLGINANQTLRLDNQSSIVAETSSGEGGNIGLNAADYVLLRHNSQISTTAGGTGRGGNITINTGFLVAPPGENSDITANAFVGPGGSVTVTAFAIYGPEFRSQLTELSDITVTSTFNTNGTFAFNPLTLIDPTSDLTVLPQNPDTPDFESGCQLTESGEQGASFTNVGAGGLAPGPEQGARSAQIHLPWVDVVGVNARDGVDGSVAQKPAGNKVVALGGCGLSGG